jgi:dTDP-4-dehydrorhamnose 3,5-epimerase
MPSGISRLNRLPVTRPGASVSDRFELISTPLSGLTVIKRKPIADERGFFERLFCAEELRDAGILKPIVQINRSLTRQKGTVRGMHFQYPSHAETKIVSCLRGEVFDVAVDIRAGSPTFLQWHGEVLSASNSQSLFIPEGFAHGFQTLTEGCEILYFVTAEYAPSSEGAIHPGDPSVSVRWPLEISQVSQKDAAQPYVSADFRGILV